MSRISAQVRAWISSKIGRILFKQGTLHLPALWNSEGLHSWYRLENCISTRARSELSPVRPTWLRKSVSAASIRTPVKLNNRRKSAVTFCEKSSLKGASCLSSKDVCNYFSMRKLAASTRLNPSRAKSRVAILRIWSAFVMESLLLAGPISCDVRMYRSNLYLVIQTSERTPVGRSLRRNVVARRNIPDAWLGLQACFATWRTLTNRLNFVTNLTILLGADVTRHVPTFSVWWLPAGRCRAIHRVVR